MKSPQLPEQQPSKRKQYKDDYLKYTSLAFQIVAAMLFFIAVGYFLDKWLHMTFPIFKLVFSILGVVAAMVVLFRMAGKSK